MSIIKRKAGSEDIVKSVLEFDAVPTEGSHNLVESGSVAQAIGNLGNAVSEAIANAEIAILSNETTAANTLRFSFSKKDYDPTVAGVGTGGTWTKLATTQANVWDWTKVGFASGLKDAFKDNDNLVSIIAANTSGVGNMYSTFQGCTSLKSVVLLDTSSTSVFTSTFQGCTSLESIPLFNTSAATNMNNMFNGCTNVEGGALALFQQASTQGTPPSSHTDTFKNCGTNTETGAAELAQIPEDWGGTMPNP